MPRKIVLTNLSQPHLNELASQKVPYTVELLSKDSSTTYTRVAIYLDDFETDKANKARVNLSNTTFYREA